jgi:predicted MFS family arabinose efflux permease
MLARLAPAERRGEASGIYNLMPGIAQMTLPSLGLLLLAAFGMPAPFVACAALGLAGAVIALTGPFRGERLATMPGPRTAGGGLLERGAVLPMVFELLFSLVFSLFLVFPPLFATSKGIPVSDLAVYYPVYGATLVGVRALSGRFLDRAPRARVVAAGAILAGVGLAVSALAETVAVLTVGGALYAAAAAFTSPTLMALAIDRADPRRLGAAMATYTLGFQLAIGAGAALWGIIIDALGYPAPYLAGILVQAVLLGALVAFRGSLGSTMPGGRAR